MSSNFFSLGSGVLSGLQTVDDDDDLLTRPKPSTTTPTSLQPEPVLKLATGVGRQQPSAPTDVRRVEKALGRTGFLDMRQTHGPTGLFGSRLEDGVRRFQKKNNLKVDGFLNPGGETARALGSSLATEARKPRRGTTLQDRMSRQLDADGARRRAGLPTPRHASASQNTRTPNALRRNGSLGLVPKLIADVLKARDPEGLTEVDDMFVQATVDDEPLARRLKSAVNGELSKQGRAERIRFRDLPSLRNLAGDFDDAEDGDPGISDPSGDRPDNPPPKTGRVGDDVPGGDFEDEDGPGISDPADDRPDNPLLLPGPDPRVNRQTCGAEQEATRQANIQALAKVREITTAEAELQRLEDERRRLKAGEALVGPMPLPRVPSRTPRTGNKKVDGFLRIIDRIGDVLPGAIETVTGERRKQELAEVERQINGIRLQLPSLKEELELLDEEHIKRIKDWENCEKRNRQS